MPCLLSTTVLHITYPGDWEHPCPRAMWQNLQGLPELSWRSRHWGSEYCWAARPPLAPSHSCMPWGASTKTECHTIERRRAGPDVITIMVFPVTNAFWKGRRRGMSDMRSRKRHQCTFEIFIPLSKILLLWNATISAGSHHVVITLISWCSLELFLEDQPIDVDEFFALRIIPWMVKKAISLSVSHTAWSLWMQEV